MFSRTATGFISGPVAELGTSAFAAATDLDLGAFAVELAVPSGEPLLLEAATGLITPTLPGPGFLASVEPEEAFVSELAAGLAVAAELLAGFAVALDAADPVDKPGAELDTGLGAVGVGLSVDVVGGAGFEVCCLGPTPSEEMG